VGNVLINLGEQNRLRDVFVIDWEFVTMAPTWLDVGNFIGELFLISYFEGTDGSYANVLDSFITAYRSFKLPLDTTRVLQFAGAHIMMSLPRRVISERSKATIATAPACIETTLKFITDPEFRYVGERDSDPLKTMVKLVKRRSQASTT
jgi:hypothetical protein